MKHSLTDLEVGWLAGLLEGEGGFQFGGGSQTIRLEMTDEDIVLRAAALIHKLTNHLPNVRFQYRGNRDHSGTYIFSISGPVACQVMKLIVPYMGYRRRQRIWQVLNRHKAKKVKPSDVAELVKLVVNNGH